ncbi:MAG: CHAT domain-containing protein, partial [Cyanobacteria bacterium P01_C01_bin.121]
MKSTILIVSSNPQDTSFLRLDRELRIIREVIQRSELSDRINIQVEWAVRTIDLLYALQRHKPWIIHFCGHGEGQAGLAFEDETGQKTTISNAALTEVASQFAADTECILLNACYSKVQAALMSKHINYVIGMSNAIEDKAALAFTRGFYTALGGKESISSAYKFGKSQIAIEYPGSIANPLTQRKATVVDSSSLQATEPAPAAAKMPLQFKKEILTEFDRSWMTSPKQQKENPDNRPEKESENASKQHASQPL